MNPLTLDFIRRWKWLLAVQFTAVSAGWIFHGRESQARLHLEIAVAIAMSWDLMRGYVRGQLGLPQGGAAIAAGLWWSVVGAGAAVQISGMLLGGVVLAPLFGLEVDPGALGLHAVLAVLMLGTAQFFLTGLPAAPPRTLSGHLKAGFFGLMWGLSMWGFFALTFIDPAGWRDVTPGEAAVLVLLGGCAVASWFTTRKMVQDRAVPVHGSAPAKASGIPVNALPGATVWRVRLLQEGRWFLPVVVMVALAAAFMISINWHTIESGWPWRLTTTDYIYRSMGMLCVMTVFPLVAVSAGTLRACRGFPVPLRHWALLVAFRPFAAGVLVFGLFTLMVWAVSRSSVVEGKALLTFLPLCSALSLIQALMLRHPRLPVVLGLLILISMLGTLFPEILRHYRPSVPGMLAAALAMLGLSCVLHLRWLGRGSRIYRLNQGILRMAGGAQR
jgi:hypothetical protein